MGDIAQKIIAEINPDAEIICDEQRIRPRKSEVNRLLGSNEKIRRLTDWNSQYTIEQGLTITIDWFRKNLHLYKYDNYNL